LEKNATTIATQRLTPIEATLTLIRHTVASRLFAPDLLVQHASFCVHVAQTVPIYRLYYPHRWEEMPAIQTHIQQRCE
jgi:predicted choloylglycine hydrolase